MLEKLKKKISDFMKSADKDKLAVIIATIILLLFIVIFWVIFQDVVKGGIALIAFIAIMFGDSIKRAYERNSCGNTCASCTGCQMKYKYINRLVYEALYSLRKMYEFEVPRSEELIQSSEPDSPLFDSKYGFPVNLSRLWFKTLWSHIKTPEELDSFDVNEFRAILRKEIIDLFNTHRIWFSESPITGLWVDLVKIDPYSIRIMIIPYCNGVTSAYLNARYEEEIRSNEQEGRCDNTVVYDDEMV